MPAELPLDPTLLRAVEGELTRSSKAAHTASCELLAHFADTGDDPTQRAVDTLVDHCAEALQGVTHSLADSSREPERWV